MRQIKLEIELVSLLQRLHSYVVQYANLRRWQIIAMSLFTFHSGP